MAAVWPWLTGLNDRIPSWRKRQQKSAEDAEVAKHRPAEKKSAGLLWKSIRWHRDWCSLIAAGDPRRGGDLMDRISSVRAILASDMGILLPKVRMKDKLILPETVYEIQIAGKSRGSRSSLAWSLVAVNKGRATTTQLPGEAVKDPEAGPNGLLDHTGKNSPRAELVGYEVVTPAAVIATHLQEVARRHAPRNY